MLFHFIGWCKTIIVPKIAVAIYVNFWHFWYFWYFWYFYIFDILWIITCFTYVKLLAGIVYNANISFVETLSIFKLLRLKDSSDIPDGSAPSSTIHACIYCSVWICCLVHCPASNFLSSSIYFDRLFSRLVVSKQWAFGKYPVQQLQRNIIRFVGLVCACVCDTACIKKGQPKKGIRKRKGEQGSKKMP